MKRFLVIALIVVVLLGGAALLVRQYLRSSRVANQVTKQLEDLYGAPVRVEEVEVGLDSSTLSGFSLYEEGSSAKDGTPWLTVGSLTADVSLWDLLRGQASPSKVTLSGAKVVLTFDRDGHLITRFPGRSAEPGSPPPDVKAIPEAVIEKGEIVFRKEGQSDLIAKNVQATLKREPDGKIVLSGTGENAELGALTLKGSLDPATRKAVVTLKAAGKVHVTQPLLDRIPFVPAVVWQEVRIAEGTTPAELTVRYDLDKRSIHYRLEMAPEDTTLTIPVVDLSAQHAHGKLVVDDNLVELRDVKGQVFGGGIATEADLDFRGESTRLKFTKIDVTDLDVNAVPDTWGIPVSARSTIPNGKLTGRATLEVTIGPAQYSPAVATTLPGLGGVASASGHWLPAVAAFSAFPRREIRESSSGTGTVKGSDGSEAVIKWSLPLRKQPQSPGAAKTALGPGAAEQLLLAAAVANLELLQGGADKGEYPEINQKLGQGAGKLLGGVHGLLNDIVDVGSRFVGSLPKRIEPKPAKPEEPPNYLDVNLKLKNVNLGQFVKSLGVKLDVPVEGKLSFEVKASIPIDRPGELDLYKVKGTARVTELVFDGIKLQEGDADIHYAKGILELTSLKGRFGADPAGGTFQGTGRLQVAPLGDLTAELTLDRVPLSQVAGPAAGKVALEGTFSGQLRARAPAGKLKELAAVEGSGKITSERLAVQGLVLEQASTSVQLKGGVLRLPDLKGKLEGTPVSASAELRLSGDYPFQARLDLKNWELSALQKLAAKGKEPPVVLAGSFTTSLDLKGTLSPFTVAASGDAATAALKVNNFRVDDVKFHWATDGKKLDLSGVDLRLYGGQAAGSAVLPLQPEAAGSVDLKLNNLDAKQLVKDLAVPFTIEGHVNGLLKGTLPPAPEGKARMATLNLDVRAPKLRVQNIPAEQLQGRLDYQDGVVDYRLEGKTLGGSFELEGQIPSPAPPKKESKKGLLKVRNVSIARLIEALKLQDTVPLAGLLNIDLNFTHDAPGGLPEGKGRLRIAELRWKGSLLVAELESEIIIAAGTLRLRELTGNLGQGTFRAFLVYPLAHPENGRFGLTLESVEAAQLLAPWLGNNVKGLVQARIRGTLGTEWRGTADVELTRGEVFGLEVTQWRLPATWHYAPGSGRSQIDVYETSAQVARGRVLGKLSLAWDYTWRVDGNVRFFGVDLQTLLRETIGPNQLGGGQMTGHFDFSGLEVRSVNDLSGTLVASFAQAQPLQLPILRQATPYLGMGPSTTFQRGWVKARLDRGLFRIQQLALEGGNLQLHIDGTVSLEGRLNLNVIAKTGDVGLPTVRLGAIGLRLPVAGPVPLVIVQEVSNLLANRVIYLEVTGTVRNPVIRPRPLPLLTEEAVRFFLNQSKLPIPLAP